jgi:CheY-like chemotaxis protein
VPPTEIKPTVLVVEDDRSLREFYRTTLRSAGYEVGAVEDGTDALRRMEDWTPDVLVLDLGLPQMDGRDLHHELRARPETRRIPIVIVSGTDTSDLNPSDFASVLQKPIAAEVLLEAVGGALRKRAGT